MMYQRANRRASRRAQEFVWPAPVGGLIRSGTNVGADPRGCEVLENFFPTAEGARLRGGSQKIATTDDPVVSLFTYRSGVAERLFAATATDVYDITSPVDPDVAPAADLSGLGSGDWSHVQFATPGGQFLCMVNGEDDYHIFDGTDWAALDADSSPAFTGVAGEDLTFVWAHKRRLWFTEKNRLSAWYLPVNSIAGAAVEFPLDGVFSLGGALLFGGTWSQDSGAGLDDLAVFVTTEGEIAVYQGSDPNTASDWQLVGVYRIGRPLDKNGWFRAGGDLIILTEDGIVSVAEALRKDRAALQAAAITAPIEDLWQDAIAARTGAFRFSVALWSTRTTLLVGIPTLGNRLGVLVANTRTGAWAIFSGWEVTCMAVFQDQLFFGTADGTVARGDVGGQDMGMPYEGRYVPRFQEFGTTQDKLALHARAIYRTDTQARAGIVAFANYEVGEFQTTISISDPGGAVWGTGVWGTSVWGASNASLTRSEWQAVTGMGFSLSVGITVTSATVATPRFDILGTVIRYEVGRAI